MNAAQAKSLPLIDILQKQGHSPVEIRKGGRELWFLSPFREEHTPSFVIDVVENIWNDFGEIGNEGQTCAGGKIVDYMMRYYMTDVKGALKEINKLITFPSSTTVKPVIKKTVSKKSILEITSVKEVFSDALFNYLDKRKVPREMALLYLKQVHYKVRGKNSKGYALGFKNRSGGYELRNKQFKGLVGNRDIMIISGLRDNQHLQLVEGVFDFLSLLCIYGRKEPISDVMILNGTGMIHQAIKEIKKRNYQNIQTWFDNDLGGEKATLTLKESFKDSVTRIKTQNHKYANFNDVARMHEALELSETRQVFGLV